MKQLLKILMSPKNFLRLKMFLDSYFLDYKKMTYSQFGEDLVLDEIFSGKSQGYYVDIGCYHPKQFSNTYKLFKRGWKGINIDANPYSIILFNRLRKRDTNLNLAIARDEKEIEYFSWGLNSENTISPAQAKGVEKDKGKPWKVSRLKTKTLKQVLDDNLPDNTNIDLLSIDVEGVDLEIIQSNDWQKYSPKVLLVESFLKDIDAVKSSELYLYLTKQGYLLTHWLNPTMVFQRNS